MNYSIALDPADSSSLRWQIPHPFQASASASTRPKLEVLLQGTPPVWFGAVWDRLLYLAALQPTEPYGSRPLNVEDVGDALIFMTRTMRDDTSPPWIGRLSTGGIQLTWRVGDVEAEAVFDRTRGEREMMVTVGENEWDAPISEADSLFASIIDRLSGVCLEQASA